MTPRQLLLALYLLVGGALLAPPARAEDSAVQTIWRLLDYLAVDYGGAVRDGSITSEAEFAEMTEFSASVEERMAALPSTPTQPQLVEQAQRLQAAIAAKLEPADVAKLARALGARLLEAYPVPLAPASPPDPAVGARLYREHCSNCHGTSGRGDGAVAANMDPPPIDFTDAARARERSIFALYQVITQGLEGTAMPSFEALSPEERWALAFEVGTFAFDETAEREGRRIWSSPGAARALIPNLEALVRLTPADLAAQVGEGQARALAAFLRRAPAAVLANQGVSLNLVRTRLAESLRAYEAGNRRAATDLALSAYLDGFEPVEPLLMARDAGLLARIEGSMGELRAQIGKQEPVESIRAKVAGVVALIDAAERVLSSAATSHAATFIGAFTILLREGLEALLIVVAIIAFLRKADRADVLPYVHGGWLAALAAGVATWAAATYLIEISGASRELTEGFGSLLAAAVLVSVGVWMHGKSNAYAWQQYVRGQVAHALSRRSAWFLFTLSFVVVYREVFETILFFTALWQSGNGAAVLGGAASAGAVLGAVAWAALRYSRNLPIDRFFAVSAVLMAVLAVVLAGKGISALQEAGWLDIRPLAWVPRADLLGLYPTVEGVATQLGTILALAIGFWLSSRPRRS